MPKITIKKVSEIDVGRILKQLIDERGYKNQREFTNAFNDWLGSIQTEQPPVTEKDVSRWINGTVKPRNNKLELFAQFFDVNVGYLQCKEHRKGVRHSSKTLKLWDSMPDMQVDMAAIKKAEQFEKLQAYCETLGYKFEYVPTKEEVIAYDAEIVDDGKIYSVEITDTIGTDPDTIVVFPDGSTVTPDEDTLKKFIENVNHVLEYEFDKLKKG